MKRSFIERSLDTIERVGDKVPHPAIIFLALCGLVIVASQILSMSGIGVTYDTVKSPPVQSEVVYEGGSHETSYDTPASQVRQGDYKVVEQTTNVESLLTGDGIRFIFTNAVQNFTGFGVVGVILVAMLGVGVAEQSGLIDALIRKLVAVAAPSSVTYIIVFMGVLSGIASDAGYLVLVPLGAAAFVSLGRHPLAGLAAAYAAASAAFGVNLLIVPFDGILVEITNEVVHLVDPNRSIDLTSNLYFGVASVLMLTAVISLVTVHLVEKRLGIYGPEERGEGEEPHIEPDRLDPTDEARGLRYSFWVMIGVLAGMGLLSAPSWGPLRNSETGSLVTDSPLMASLIFVTMLILMAGGLAYGRGARTLPTSTEAINAIVRTFAGLAGLIVLLLIVAQLIAYLDYTNMATVAAVGLSRLFENANAGAPVLLVGFMVVTMFLNIAIPGIVPKWAILAPVVVPLFLRLGVGPQTVLAAYRVGDSPTTVITPLMVYLPFILMVARRYKRDAGVGTVVSLMLPYTVVVAVAWIAFFVAWYLLGIPLGPGAPLGL